MTNTISGAPGHLTNSQAGCTFNGFVRDGLDVFTNFGGMAELLITNEEHVTPVFTMETGQLDMKTLAARSYPLDDVVEAYQVCGDREVIATVVTPNT